MSFTARFDFLSWTGTAELARDGSLGINCVERNSHASGDRSGWPASIEATLIGRQVYARDNRLKLPSGRVWTVAEWGGRQVVPAAMFALLDPTLSLEDPVLIEALRPGPAMIVGTGKLVSPSPGQRALNGSRVFSLPEISERLREWHTGAGDTSYLAFGVIVDAEDTPVRFTAEFYPPAAGPYLFEASIESLGQPVDVKAPPADQTVAVSQVVRTSPSR